MSDLIGRIDAAITGLAALRAELLTAAATPCQHPDSVVVQTVTGQGLALCTTCRHVEPVAEPEAPTEPAECQHPNRLPIATLGNPAGWLCPDCEASS